MRIVLTQPRSRAGDGSDIESLSGLVRRVGFAGEPNDAIVLPEMIGEGSSSEKYLADVTGMAREFGCHVVGGSHVATSTGSRINQGFVVGPDGQIVAHYEKANPYSNERKLAMAPGVGGASFRIGEVECSVLVCADFFHVETYRTLGVRPDVIFVPAFSVTRKSSPDLARARWRHAMIARAFEQGAYVAVSDFAFPVRGNGNPSSGVAGLAHPDPLRPDGLLRTLGRSQVAVFEVDPNAGRLLREDQRSRGFDIGRVKEAQS